jgi:hypothetical protein
MTTTIGHGPASGSQKPNGSRTVPVANGKATYAEKHQIADHFIGGNKLENAPSSAVKDFVAAHDGHTVITNVSKHRGKRVQLDELVADKTPPRF